MILHHSMIHSFTVLWMICSNATVAFILIKRKLDDAKGNIHFILFVVCHRHIPISDYFIAFVKPYILSLLSMFCCNGLSVPRCTFWSQEAFLDNFITPAHWNIICNFSGENIIRTINILSCIVEFVLHVWTPQCHRQLSLKSCTQGGSEI